MEHQLGISFLAAVSDLWKRFEENLLKSPRVLHVLPHKNWSRTIMNVWSIDTSTRKHFPYYCTVTRTISGTCGSYNSKETSVYTVNDEVLPRLWWQTAALNVSSNYDIKTKRLAFLPTHFTLIIWKAILSPKYSFSFKNITRNTEKFVSQYGMSDTIRQKRHVTV